MSATLDILNAIKTRCAAITVAGGYNTDIGLKAEVNYPRWNPDEVTTKGVVAVFDQTEDNEEPLTIEGDEYILTVDFAIEAHINVGTNNPVTVAHNVCDDIKTAVLDSTDRTVGGLALDLVYTGRENQYPDSGSEIVSVRMTFNTQHVETYGSP